MSKIISSHVYVSALSMTQMDCLSPYSFTSIILGQWTAMHAGRQYGASSVIQVQPVIQI